MIPFTDEPAPLPYFNVNNRERCKQQQQQQRTVLAPPQDLHTLRLGGTSEECQRNINQNSRTLVLIQVELLNKVISDKFQVNKDLN
ncbi:uncharacterized protein V6R79_022014 [Siganus canaliculatus]